MEAIVPISTCSLKRKIDSEKMAFYTRKPDQWSHGLFNDFKTGPQIILCSLCIWHFDLFLKKIIRSLSHIEVYRVGWLFDHKDEENKRMIRTMK